MTLAKREAWMTVEDFLDWHPDGEKWELIGGIPVQAMGESALHDTVKSNVHGAYARRLRPPSQCRPGVDSRLVRADDFTAYKPDAYVNCAPFGDPMEPLIEKPAVVFEVSVTSLEHDRLNKRVGYFRNPDVEHVVVVNAVESIVYHYRRGEGRENMIGFHDTLALDGTVSLDIPVAEFFEFLPEGR